MVEQAADDSFGFEFLFEPLCSRGVPALLVLLPLVGIGFEPLFGEPDLFLADRQHGRLLIAIGAELVLLTTDVILKSQAFELHLLTFDFDFVMQASVVLGDRGSARFDALADHFRIDGRQEFRPRLFHREASFQRQTVRAFHLTAHHLEALSARFKLFEF